MSDYCPECGREFTEFNYAVTKGESAVLGVYYQGDRTCSLCVNKYYESAWVEHDEDVRDGITRPRNYYLRPNPKP